MTGAELNGRRITVEFSKRDKPREPTPGKYLGTESVRKVRNVPHLCGGRVTTDGRTLRGRTLRRRAVRTSDAATVMRSAADTKSLVLVKKDTKDGGRVTPNRRADDLYTTPTPTNIQLQLQLSNKVNPTPSNLSNMAHPFTYF